MSYVLYDSRQNRYIGKKNKRWSFTKSGAAKFVTEESANNYLSINLRGDHPEADIESMQILPSESAPEITLEVRQMSEDEASQKLRKLEDFVLSPNIPFEDFDSLLAHFSDDVRQCDQITQDLLHKVEFSSLNAADGYKIYKQLHEVRIRRRKAKDSCYILNALHSSGLLKSVEVLQRTFESMEGRVYEPRVLKELFEAS